MDKDPVNISQKEIEREARESLEWSQNRRKQAGENKKYYILVGSIVAILLVFSAFIILEVWLFPR